MIIRNTDTYRLSYEEDNKLMVWQPKGKMKSDEFREGFEIGSAKLKELYKEGVAVNWLNLVEDIKVVGIGDLKWLNESINKTAIRCGCKKVAFTKPNDTFGKAGIKLYAQFTTTDILKIKYFDTEDDARKWLM